MPVLITAAVLAKLFRSGRKEHGSFLDLTSLRARVAALPESERRERALEIVGALQEVAASYARDSAVSLEEYTALVRRYDAGVDSWIQQGALQDAAFGDLLEQVIQTRQSLLEVLKGSEWRKVFGRGGT
jgi:hypothetical protein